MYIDIYIYNSFIIIIICLGAIAETVNVQNACYITKQHVQYNDIMNNDVVKIMSVS